jgi:CheY-like chemotaxis protein
MPEPKTILIAEDDVVVRQVTRKYLEKVGYRVLEAEAFQEVFASLEENAIDLALVSEHLPNEEVIYEGKPEWDRLLNFGILENYTKNGMQLILLTSNDASCRVSQSAFTEHFLHKPFHPAELIHLVRQVLTDSITHEEE